MEGDRTEPDGDREAEREIRQPEHDWLGRQLAEVAADPGGGGRGHRAGDDERAEDSDADRRPGPAAARDQRQEHAQQTAGRRGQDRDARVGQRERQRDRPERPERHRRRVATRARGEADEGEREADDRAEDQEQAAVGRGGEQRATDLDRRRRVDGERRDDGRDQSDEPDRRGDAGPPPAEQGDAAAPMVMTRYRTRVIGRPPQSPHPGTRQVTRSASSRATDGRAARGCVARWPVVEPGADPR